jgi:hypothetical protein
MIIAGGIQGFIFNKSVGRENVDVDEAFATVDIKGQSLVTVLRSTMLTKQC